MPIRYEVIDQPTDAMEQAVESELRDFNLAQNPKLWAAMEDPAHAPRPLKVFAFDDAGTVIGGLIAETRFAWLKIGIMSVGKEQRARGIGSNLLRAAETEAVARRCRYAFVDTMSYQAPDFYQKLGYRVAGFIPNWDSHGHDKYYFVKTLQS